MHRQIVSFKPERSEWLRLRTLILLRWMAIAGQIAALIVADQYFGLILPLFYCYGAVGLAVLANLVAIFLFPANKRLTDSGAMQTLLFDLAQLCLLLYLTGGLSNPFALLVLAPIIVSASALETRTTVVLGAASVLFVTMLARFNIPLHSGNGSILQFPALFKFGFWASITTGILFLGLYSRRIATEMRSLSDALLATQLALVREQTVADLGGIVAAAAHELGTPLATIKLVSTELLDELKTQPALQADARLIREQADRCRDILRSMGKTGRDDALLRQAPLRAVLDEAAEPHITRGKRVIITLSDENESLQPSVLRRPELIHGLRNLIQNAVDFARTTVWIDAIWTDARLTIRITDDGAGFAPGIIGRIGDPFVRTRRSAEEMIARPGYESMGLGLFIAKTLLERIGADLTFANAGNPFLKPGEQTDRRGAIVEATWPADAIIAPMRALPDSVALVK